MPALWRLLFIGFLVLGAAGCGGSADRGLLAGRAPRAATQVKLAEVLTDGRISRRGDAWDSDLSATFPSGASVEWDLGESRAIGSAYVQADQNDEYVVSLSEDGATFSELWRAPVSVGRGMQPRMTGGLQGRGRYVRLSVGRGDGSHGVAELALFESAGVPAETSFTVKRGFPRIETVRSAILHLALAFAGFVLLSSARRRWLTLVALALPIAALVALWPALAAGWPFGQREVSLVRAASAIVALVALGREALSSERFAPSRAAVAATLGVAAVAAFASFGNLGHAQFWDAKNARPSFVHNHDMRVYYPVAKYFRELRFDGVYLASVAAYDEDVTSATLESLGQTPLRDLRTHHMRRVSEVTAEIAAIRQRFSAERWEAFRRDMRWFRETMGDRDYLGSLTDHGGNATPVWLAVAHLLFAKTEASRSTLLAGAVLDPLLLLAAFAAIWRTFGWRTALVSMVVFGANDFYMFGSNWSGATLRHDWMACLALGACALKRERWVLGGALLALSALIRAFPAFALVGAAIPAAYWLAAHLREHRRLPSRSEIWQAQRPLLLTALGAVACVLVFVTLSSILLSPSAWSEWLHKVSILDRDPHTNHVSLRGLVAGNDGAHLTTLAARMPLFVTLAAGFSLLVVLAARGKSLAHAAILGTLLIPVAFNPANYYIHFIFVLPLLAVERPASFPPLPLRDFSIGAILLALCALQYWTVPIKDWELHFQLATVLLFSAVALLLGVILWSDRRSIEA